MGLSARRCFGRLQVSARASRALVTAGSAFLGINGKSASVPGTETKNASDQKRVTAWKLQRAAQKLLPNEAVAGCIRDIKDRLFNSGVDVKFSPSKGRAHYGNLVTCGSVWHCPICAQKISEVRRKELQRCITEHSKLGGHVVLATYTFPHSKAMSLTECVTKQQDAIRRLKSTRAYRAAMSAAGSVGAVRSLEVTYGANGWHPHTHELLFIEAGKESALEALRFLWGSAVKKAGLDAINEHGFDLRGGDSAADYVAKWGREPQADGWNVSHEMTKSHIKQGRGQSQTPFGLLRLYVEKGDQDAGLHFINFANCFKGRRQLFYSPGLKQLYAIEETTDAEIVERESEDSETLGTISKLDWRVVLRMNARGEVLVIAERYGWRGVQAFLEVLRKKTPIDEHYHNTRAHHQAHLYDIPIYHAWSKAA